MSGHETHVLEELKEFASFTTAEQRYIRRSLDVALERADAADHWARGIGEAATMGCQARAYDAIDQIRASIPDGIEPSQASALLASLIELSAFDLAQGRIGSFAAYRFLYERLIGAAVRPWLVSAFSAAAALPGMHPEQRLELFRSLECREIASPGWSNREPEFFPEWIEKVPLAECE